MLSSEERYEIRALQPVGHLLPAKRARARKTKHLHQCPVPGKKIRLVKWHTLDAVEIRPGDAFTRIDIAARLEDCFAATGVAADNLGVGTTSMVRSAQVPIQAVSGQLALFIHESNIIGSDGQIQAFHDTPRDAMSLH